MCSLLHAVQNTAMGMLTHEAASCDIDTLSSSWQGIKSFTAEVAEAQAHSNSEHASYTFVVLFVRTEQQHKAWVMHHGSSTMLELCLCV